MYNKINRALENVLFTDNWYNEDTQLQCRSLYQTLVITKELDNINTYLKDIYNLGAIYDCNVELDDFKEFMNHGIEGYLV